MNPKSTLQAPEVIKLNDSLYQLHRPAAGTRSMLVVFFHGFQLEDYANAHWKTWTSGDGSIWPQTWLAEKFPEAHVLSVSYNQWMTNDRDRGTMDVFNICENLKTDLLRTNGMKHRCPIILVGHSFGGLVIKELCVNVSNNMNCEPNPSRKSSLADFLEDLKGIFFYGTPHRGIRKKALTAFTAENQSLREYAKVLSSRARKTEFFFSCLSESYNWQIGGVGESLPIEKSGFSALGVGVDTVGVVTPEAFSRYGLTYNTAPNTDHITITRPKATTEITFTALVDLLSRIEAMGLDMEGPVHQSQWIPEYPAGLERSSHDVVEKLVNMEKLKNARVLGIVGMGGIGKSTIAKAVFNKIFKEFEYTCFLDNVKEIEIHQLEHQVLSAFYHHGSPLKQKDAHWSTLKGKKTLMVMDDLTSNGQLKKLPKPSDFGVGSRLIITSRDKSILASYAEYDVYEVDFLRDSEARDLFCQCAFGSQMIPQGSQHLEADVTRVLKKCQGLPLTLELMGSYLKGHGEAEFWDETIENLGNVQDITGDQENTLRASLNISYESLGPIEREIFHEAATCFFEQPLGRALAVWKTNHGHSSTGWGILLNKSMVKQVPKTKWKFDDSFGGVRRTVYMEVWVHQHFRDWAKRVFGKRMLIGVDEDADRAIDILKAVEEFGAVTETLRLRDGSQQTKLQLNLLDKLEKLKYLELEGISHEGSIKTCPRLSILRWNYCHDVVNVEQMKCFDFQVLPLNVKQMNNLAILELSSMKIPEEFPEALENLVNLHILSLCYLEGLDHLPEAIGNLSLLRRFELKGLRISTLPDSFCELSALTDLSIVGCSSLQTLPESFGKLSCLEYMWIAKCSILERLPYSFGNLKFLKRLCISNCPTLEELPQNFQRLSSLEKFQLYNCSESSRLPNLGQLKSLLLVMIDGDFLNLSRPIKKLTLSGRTLEKLSASFGFLSALEYLDVFDHGVLTRLSENLGTLSTLQRLTIRCWDLEELPESLGNLSALTYLTLECPSLERLPDSFKHLSSLETLVLNRCTKLEVLPHVSELKSLVRLTINGQVLKDLSTIKELTGTGLTLEIAAKNASLANTGTKDINFHSWEPGLLKLENKYLDDLHDDQEHSEEDSGAVVAREIGPSKFLSTKDLIRQVKDRGDGVSVEADVTGKGSRMVKDDLEHSQKDAGSTGADQISPSQFFCAEDLIREVEEGGEDGYILSFKWFISLEENERDSLLSILRTAGYLKICQTSTTVVFERIKNDVQNRIMRNDAPSSVTKPSPALAGRIEQVVQPEKGDAMLGISEGKSLSFDSRVDTANACDSHDLPDSNTYAKTEASFPNPRPVEQRPTRLESLIAALKSNRDDSFCVSNVWLSRLEDYEKEVLDNSVLEAGYAKTSQTGNTTSFERMRESVRHPASDGPSNRSSRNDGAAIETRNRGTSEISGSLSDMTLNRKLHNEDDASGSIGVANRIGSSQDDGSTPCHPQYLKVACRPVRTSSMVSAPSTQACGSAICVPEYYRREQLGDSVVTMTEMDKSLQISTSIEKPLQLTTVPMTVDFSGDGSSGSGVVPDDLTAEVTSIVRCCVRLDQNSNKVRIKFHKISGKILHQKEPQYLALALSSVRTNVFSVVKRNEAGGTRWDEVLLHLDDEYDLHPERRRVLDGDLLWLQPERDPDNSIAPGSTTLWLQGDIIRRLNADLGRDPKTANRLHFQDRRPVVFEGEVPTILQPKSFLETSIRYELEFSYLTPKQSITRDAIAISCIRRSEVVNFDCYLVITTNEFGSD